MGTLTVPLVRWVNRAGYSTLLHIVDDDRKNRPTACGCSIPWQRGKVYPCPEPIEQTNALPICRRCRRSWGLHPSTSATEGGETDG